MNINYELYKIFIKVAEYGNITKAANELLISQPAISKSIKTLEDELGGALFIRTKKGVVLTEEGKEFYKHIKMAIEHINNAENKFTDFYNLNSGTVKIGASQTLVREFLVSYLDEFHKLYPNIKIEIDTSIGEDLINKLKNGLLDMVIINLPFDTTADIEIHKCKEVHDCFIGGEKYQYLSNNLITLNELNNYPLILQNHHSITRRFLDNYLKCQNIFLNPSITLASYSLVIDLTKIDLGIGYATKEYIQKDLDNKILYEIKTVEKIPSRFIGMALSKNNIHNFASKKLIEIILKDVK